MLESSAWVRASVLHGRLGRRRCKSAVSGTRHGGTKGQGETSAARGIEQLPSSSSSLGPLPGEGFAGIDPLTKRRRYLRETAPTEVEALIAATKLDRQVDEGRHPKSNITVRQAIEQWLDAINLEPGSPWARTRACRRGREERSEPLAR